VRHTGRDADGCGQYSQSTCGRQSGCSWSSAQRYCSGTHYALTKGTAPARSTLTTTDKVSGLQVQ
jgi:hypothetical protein